MHARESVEKLIIEKAMKDETFRIKLLKDPQPTVESELGLKFPAGLRFEVVEETPDMFYLVLPAQVVQQKEDELSEMELNQVAGGEGIYWGEIVSEYRCTKNPLLC